MRYEALFPYETIEILNGILAMAMFWMTLFLVVHMVRAWRRTRARYLGPRGIIRTIKCMHRKYKPEVALLTITFALCIRTFILWYVRWLKNNDINWNDFVTNNSGELLIWLTLVTILGVACWVRVILPIEGRRAIAIWCAMLVSSFTFGVGMHYLF